MKKKKAKVNYQILLGLIIGISNIYGCSTPLNSPITPAVQSSNNSGNSNNTSANKPYENSNGYISGYSSGKDTNTTAHVTTPVTQPTAYTPAYPSYPTSPVYTSNPDSGTNYPHPPTSSSNPVGQTGGTSDIKERATFNGKIYDANGKVVEGAIVTAKSVDLNVSWVGEPQTTTNGAYVFRNAPIGARVEITVTLNGVTQTRTEVLKSNLQGDPRSNVFDFNLNDNQDGDARISGNIYDGNGNPIVNATITAKSTDPSVNWSGTTQVNAQGNYYFENVPVGIKVKITVVTSDGKIKSREETINSTINKINFGGDELSDKTFAITGQQDNFFVDYGVNPFIDPLIDRLSTFSVDVDTASYTWMRKSISEENTLPDKKSVRIEEYINFFDYNYPLPTKDSFTINTDLVSSPTGGLNKKILRIGLQGKQLQNNNRKDAVLTFVIDVSGSMNMDNRLGLVKQSLELLVRQLKKGDKVGIVIFGSESRVVLEPKSVDNENEIMNAIHSLQIEGSTNTEAGLLEGFKLAQKFYKSGASNRVILCSDGVANVGNTGPDTILRKIKEVNEAGIALSTIGFGMGNYNDVLMEQLANNGDGYYSYVDNIQEAYRVFVENLNGSLQTIAKDVKVQVDFNPDTVSQYRLLGYENRDIKDEDFRNDSVDAGEVGINTSVTALYEVEVKNNVDTRNIAEVFLRYRDSDDLNQVKEFKKAISGEQTNNNFSTASASFKLAASVALYAEILRKSYWARDGRFSDVLRIAREARNGFENTEKIDEFINLVEKAARLQQIID
jgi:Ca-activated chloride channel family protein